MRSRNGAAEKRLFVTLVTARVGGPAGGVLDPQEAGWVPGVYLLIGNHCSCWPDIEVLRRGTGSRPGFFSNLLEENKSR